MTIDLIAVVFDATDPERLGGFWSSLTGRPKAEFGGVTVEAAEPGQLPICFVANPQVKVGPNRMHFDLNTTSKDHQRDVVAQALGLGARQIDVGQTAEEGHVVLADPDDNEFCVLGPGNNFLADCGFVGGLSCDGSERVGRFWSRALDWPLVWDHDQETAIQSPRGGMKLAWGGPPIAPKTGKERVHLDLAVTDGDQAGAIDRLLSLGAEQVDIGQGDDVSWTVLADPDGNEFCLH